MWAVTNGVEPVIDLAAEDPAVEGHHHGLAGGQEHRVVVGQPVGLTLAQLTSLSHCVQHLRLQHLKYF